MKYLGALWWNIKFLCDETLINLGRLVSMLAKQLMCFNNKSKELWWTIN